MTEIVIPILSYEINTTVRQYREEKLFTQEEFAFLIGRTVTEVMDCEDLTKGESYDLNFLNLFARILAKSPRDFLLNLHSPTPLVKVKATQSRSQKHTTYKGTLTAKGVPIRQDHYHIAHTATPPIPPADSEQVLQVLEAWLLEGFFRPGVTGLFLYETCLQHLAAGDQRIPKDFRPQHLIDALAVLSGRRKRPKLLPMRRAPKTEEKWILYQEDC
ncbi:hypothetical protein E2P86_10830 [Sphingobacterium psychroaquaticum]|uniref:hypothetical protein n=1 Tax=Sphingobacterium psychroaquaticum TaxID=561061 RepID=UPI00106DC928|nr:hypothetical protein [Sphingobacterium psychroaquaticum]QBQ41616.1 hypothetical protein E2P86_10830 [Sphingobacterium psychroaquaticum]